VTDKISVNSIKTLTVHECANCEIKLANADELRI